jgi:D-alanyl-D-alanine carboxypeptidase
MKSDYMKLKTVCLLVILSVISLNWQSDFHNSKRNTLQFQAALDNQISDNMPGILVTVISKEKNTDWSGASGYSDKEKKIKLLPDQTFRIASVTKTFVAATVLRLWEDGKLKLEDPVEKYISREHSEILERGGYNVHKITVLNLLTHSGGLSEHTSTEKYKIPYINTNHIWTRTEQLTDLINYTKPVGEPGKQFSYSDSGYILLGEIIENLTHKSLGDAIMDKLKLKKLGLTSIHMEDARGEFSADRIHQYFEGTDTYNINPTLDLYGGGGLLSSTRDLCLFYQYLFENKIFRKKYTLGKMLTSVNYPEKQSLDYRIGIWKTEIEGMTAYTHTGFWGTQVIYIPEIKTSIAVNYSQRWNKKGFAPVIPLIVEELLKN